MDLKEREKEITNQFDELERRVNNLLSQRRQIDAQITDLKQEQLRLNGKYLLIQDMKEDDGESKESPSGKVQKGKEQGKSTGKNDRQRKR